MQLVLLFVLFVTLAEPIGNSRSLGQTIEREQATNTSASNVVLLRASKQALTLCGSIVAFLTLKGLHVGVPESTPPAPASEGPSCVIAAAKALLLREHKRRARAEVKTTFITATPEVDLCSRPITFGL